MPSGGNSIFILLFGTLHILARSTPVISVHPINAHDLSLSGIPQDDYMSCIREGASKGRIALLVRILNRLFYRRVIKFLCVKLQYSLILLAARTCCTLLNFCCYCNFLISPVVSYSLSTICP